MEITQLTEASEQALADINRVNAQLHDDGRLGTIDDLRTIVNDKNTVLVVVKDGEKIIGLSSLYILHKIGRRSAYIEDVVVDSAYRGKGLGEQLVRKTIEIARSKDVKKLYLTSRAEHAAAHSLYKKVGFTVKETTVFRLDL
jgi:ribosomal protein S18 acetylase RimI-like enzyme